MTRAQFCKEIAERSGVPKDTVAAVIAQEEHLVYEIMATCDSIKYVWGTIMGVEKAPTRISGMYTEIDAIKRNSGWSNWKRGYPKVKWTRAARVCDTRPPADYFEQTQARYTSLARQFRKDAGLPEIAEFEGLSEEKIQEICKKADTIEFEALPRSVQFHKKKDKKSNLVKKRALIDYWEKIGYIPQGVLYDEELGDENYQGEQRDTIDHCLKTKLEAAKDLPEKLEAVLFCKDMMECRDFKKPHPEIEELEKQFRQEMEEKGIKPIKHIKRTFDKKLFTIKFQGQEDPWGLLRTGKRPAEREAERRARLQALGKELKEEEWGGDYSNEYLEDLDALEEFDLEELLPKAPKKKTSKKTDKSTSKKSTKTTKKTTKK